MYREPIQYSKRNSRQLVDGHFKRGFYFAFKGRVVLELSLAALSIYHIRQKKTRCKVIFCETESISAI